MGKYQPIAQTIFLLIFALFWVCFYVAVADDTCPVDASHQGPWVQKFFCEAKLADVALVYFTFCLVLVTFWLVRATIGLQDVTRMLAEHLPKVERAYLSGGGPANPPNGPFCLTINNYGKTPGVLLEYAVEFCDVGEIPPQPLYLGRGYNRRIRHRGTYRPEEHAKEIAQLPFPRRYEHGVVYGRFWYEDIFRDRIRVASFILSLSPADTVIPVGISREYTFWD